MHHSWNVLLCFGLLLTVICPKGVRSVPLRQDSGKQSLELEIEGIKHVLEEDGIDIDKISLLTSSPLQFTNISSYSAVTFPIKNEENFQNETHIHNSATSISSLKFLYDDVSSMEEFSPMENYSMENINKSEITVLTDGTLTTAGYGDVTLDLTTNSLMPLHNDDHQLMRSSSGFSEQAVNEDNATLSYSHLPGGADNQQSSEYPNPLGSSIEEFEDFEKVQDITQDEDVDDEDDVDDDFDAEGLPAELQNLPHDIPKDRTIAEVLAENTIKDKQFDELRIKELIHELMSHTLGFGEVYSDEPDYDSKDN